MRRTRFSFWRHFSFWRQIKKAVHADLHGLCILLSHLQFLFETSLVAVLIGLDVLVDYGLVFYTAALVIEPH